MNRAKLLLILLIASCLFLVAGCDLDDIGFSVKDSLNYESHAATENNELGENGQTTQEPTNSDNKVSVKVTRVVDGDTIIVNLNGKDERVRLIGIDTPETVHPERGEEPFGREASDYTKSRLDGEQVYLEFDVQQRDQYGRLLAYVWIGEEHFNATLVEQGYATVSTWPPNVKYVEVYTALQQEAREESKGLWGIASLAEAYIVGDYEIDPDTKRPIQKININEATAEELQLIPGVGEVLAQRIIEARPFANVNELTKVNGIGQKTLDNMREYVDVE